MWAFSSRLSDGRDGFGLLGVGSDAVHPMSLVFDRANFGRWDLQQLNV
jgi:hypothetical protein